MIVGKIIFILDFIGLIGLIYTHLLFILLLIKILKFKVKIKKSQKIKQKGGQTLQYRKQQISEKYQRENKKKSLLAQIETQPLINLFTIQHIHHFGQMQQIEKQAFALKIYEDMKIKLQEILKQFEMEKQEMEIKIQILQHQISEKDLKIQTLTSRLKDKYSQKSVNLNLVTIQNNFESEPILGKQKQRSNNAEKYVQKQFLRIDINSYFTALIDKNTQKQSKQSTQSTQNTQTDNTHDTLHFSRSCQKLTSPTFSNQNYQNFSHQIQSSQKIKIISNYFQNQQEIKTIKQTSFKNFLSEKSIKQNDLHFLSSKQFKPNQITINEDQNQQNLFVCSNINKNFKQSTQKGWKTSNFIPQNVKPRKIPFTVIKTPNLKV